MTFLLNHQLVAAPEANPQRVAFVLHGILGALGNWRTFGRHLVTRCPSWRLVLVDLRCHGASHPAPPPHTLEACAEDLARLAEHLGQPPELVVGHSFGGKVAMAYGRLASPAQVVCLDTPPGAWPPSRVDDSEVARVIRALRDVPQPLGRREDLLEHMAARGFSDSLSQWMTTNLTRGPEGLVWKFDLDAVQQLLEDYVRQDFWPWLRSSDRRTEVTAVRAARSDRWGAEALGHFDDPTMKRLRLLTLPDAGHWLHVDNPQGLLELLADGPFSG